MKEEQREYAIQPQVGEHRHRCDCPGCPCNVPMEQSGRQCPECKRNNCMDWMGIRREPELEDAL